MILWVYYEVFKYGWGLSINKARRATWSPHAYQRMISYCLCKIFSINIRMVIDEMYCTIHYNWFVLLSTYHRQRKIDIKVKLIDINWWHFIPGHFNEFY